MQFVLVLHSHLPYVLNHGRWPHGSDWLCEATLDTYLPLLATLRSLAQDEIPAPVTLGFTPVLANQLASPAFRTLMDDFFRQRLAACDEAPDSLTQTGDTGLLPLVAFWREHFLGLQKIWEELDGDLLGGFAELEASGRLETMTSAATHGFLPLLAREESIRLQLAAGTHEHERLFGRRAAGCWLPECAYAPGGRWDPLPGISRPSERVGLEEYLAEAGLRYFFIDTHMAEAGESLGWYGDVPHGVERFDAEWEGEWRAEAATAERSPHCTYRIGERRDGAAVAAFVREPASSMQVWSRHHGYPGDEWYLEFHKIRWPGGLKLWRVTGPGVDLGRKAPYDPGRASQRVRDHASHFTGFLGHLQRRWKLGPSGVVMAPFDTELFGHWWFEGVEFLGEIYRRLPYREGVIPVTASHHLDAFPPQHQLIPLQGSWGANGDFSMWLNEGTRWTWERLWPLEERFWSLAPRVLEGGEASALVTHAARQLLLAQSSDWQFMISTGAVPDYAARRFELHASDLSALLDALESGSSPSEAERLLSVLEERDTLFPELEQALRVAVRSP